ncbi:NAD-dependent epimerase/dehydratase family protein [Microbacterium sp. SSM24]|uniref:NAD-dependent epimerase/dehydratase family protein n=1 Tax=Microbacterium sp. SSM24 TaxID=2991714 RepID=UPI002227ED67|nr:NAD-dependent epimerase/dehydratase family protein [Microbacterium sp. SSM24]MCW3492718.1 NAD-dependent epimerase/dehydratase family protein [Microbacterium sp. SSM24]
MTKHIFITGASGYLGQAIAQRLLRAGHRVSGLVRSDAAAKSVTAQGITPVIGGLDDVASLDLSGYDAIVDTATADHAPSTAAFIAALAGTDRTFVRTSGTGVYTDLAGGVASEVVYREDDEFTPAEVVAARYRSDELVLAAKNDGVRTVVIRPAMVYGDGASEQLPLLLRQALSSGRSIFAETGENRWGNVYLYDLAELYLLALEKAPAGSVYNIASGECELREIADGIAQVLGQGAGVSVSLDTARETLGARWVDVALASNSRVDSTLARTELGWNPVGPTLLEDLVHGSYKRIWASKGDPHDHVAKH